MLFNSVEFIFLFLPLTLLVFYLLRYSQPLRVSVGWLVAASLFFYGWWKPAYLLIIIASIAFNYAAGVMMARMEKGKFLVLSAAVFGNLALLGYYKYTNFVVDNINAATNAGFQVPHIVLPLAISFFTFQQIAYVVDSYRGLSKEMDFTRYCLFVTFFPQLIAGPIVHHGEMIPQFARRPAKRAIPLHLAVGLSIFIIGLFKKVVLADGVAAYATPVFDAAAAGMTLSFFEAWTGVLAYSLQIYFDFSGYSDMAIGLGRMFGIRLPINFDSPYKSKNIIEFWRRWHITLSRFLRDYLYFPLGGNRKGKMRRYVNLVTVMLLGGVWHGAGWTFAVWGLLHGGYLLVNHAWHDLRERFGLRASGGFVPRLLAQGLTLLAVVVAWVFFRAADLGSAASILESMAGMNGVSLVRGWQGYFADAGAWAQWLNLRFDGMFYNGLADFNNGIVWVAALFAVALLMPNTQHLMRWYRPTIGVYARYGVLGGSGARWRLNTVCGLLLGIMFFVICSKWISAAPSEFIYFNF